MALMIRDKYTQLLLIFNYNLNQVSLNGAHDSW